MTSLAHPASAALPLLSSAEAQHLRPAAWSRLSLASPRRFDAQAVRALWAQLHPSVPTLPDEAQVDGWAAFHNGDFAAAAVAAEALGEAGSPLLNHAVATYAVYVEPREGTRLALLRQVATRTQARLQAQPDDPSALYWMAFALGRHAQAVSVARALAQGLGGQIKDALERLLALQPQHVEARFALGAFHAEVIDKVGPLVARMTYGVRAEVALELFEQGLALHPGSAIGRMEYAHALLALYGHERIDEATRLYEQAAAIEPLDLRTRLDQEKARLGLSD